MNYTGQFKNINNTLYQIDIDINNGITGSTEMVLDGEPFKVDYNAGETIYEPLKLSNSTCSILSSSYLFDIYSSTAQGTKLTLKNVDSNSVEWVGYVTPNIYTQAFEQPIEQIDLEAIDGLSTLENYTYNQIDFNGKKIKSLQDILIQCIKQCNCYNHIYINQNNSLTSSIDKTKIIDKLFIAEQNFFNSDSTPATDTTPAIAASSMNYKEVLSEILKYLGYTIIAFGDSVYILDYDYISNSYSNYSTYSTTNNWLTYSTGTTNLIDVHSITNDSFKAAGGTIELDTTYNQISIKTSLFKEDSLIPDFFDVNHLNNITLNTHYWEDALYPEVNGYKQNLKYFKNDMYNYIWYDNDVNWNNITIGDNITVSNLTNNIGAIVTQQFSYKLSDPAPTSKSYSNYIQLVRHLTFSPTAAQNVAMPVLRTIVGSIPNNSYLFDNYNINISGSALWMTNDKMKQYYIDPSVVGKYDTDFLEEDINLTAKIQIGNKYWNGTNWTTTDSTFKILFAKGTETHLFNKWFNIKNSVTRAQLNVSGQLIPIHLYDQLIGDIELTLYTPKSIETDGDFIQIDNVFIKDLSFKLVKENLGKNDETDTEYLNVINSNFVNKFSDLSFKVCSQTNKGMNYSSVIELSDIGTYKYNSGIFNKSLNKSQLQEYNIIEKYVDQYSTPKKILNLTLGNNYYPYTLFNCSLFPADKYIINKMSIDYYNSNNLVTIVEKI